MGEEVISAGNRWQRIFYQDEKTRSSTRTLIRRGFFERELMNQDFHIGRQLLLRHKNLLSSTWVDTLEFLFRDCLIDEVWWKSSWKWESIWYGLKQKSDSHLYEWFCMCSLNFIKLILKLCESLSHRKFIHSLFIEILWYVFQFMKSPKLLAIIRSGQLRHQCFYTFSYY